MLWIQSNCLLFCFLIASIPTAAQVAPEVTSDGTLSTTVTSPDGKNFTIDGGNKPEGGSNLFHSFQDFSVPTNGSAFFNNAVDVENIFSRVTGGNISSIDGLIKANGSANLFLINPAGIIFGPNASLNIGGSFLGSTAESILFPEGELSATNLDNPPLLTINAPIGLGIRDEPAPITNQSVVNNLGLQVNTGESIFLVGGDLNFEGGIISAAGGNIHLGGLAGAGKIGLEGDGNLSFPSNVQLGNIFFRNGAIADVSGAGGGAIEINANNLELNEGSLLLAGIEEGMGFADAVAGDIDITIVDRLILERKSKILSQTVEGTQGSSGNIEINTDFLEAKNRSLIATDSKGIGNSGNININARNSILLEENTFVRTEMGNEGVGKAGDIDIVTNTLTLNDGLILSQIKQNGEGTTGNVTVVANQAVNSIDGKIDTNLNANSKGKAGNIKISTPSLSLEGGSRIRSRTLGQGDTGEIIINATESISLDRQSLIVSEVDRRRNNNNAVGNAGNITLTTGELNLVNDSQISSTSFARGDAGDITINASEPVILDDSTIRSNLNDLSSGDFDAIGDGGDINVTTSKLTLTNKAELETRTSGEGQVGKITIQTDLLEVKNESRIISRTFGKGDAGDITLDAGDSIFLDRGRIISEVDDGNRNNNNAVGNAGNITLKTRELNLVNNSRITSTSFARGDAGDITIDASERVILDDSRIRSNLNDLSSGKFDAIGDGGDININTDSLHLTNGALIDVSTSGIGDVSTNGISRVGNIIIDATNVSLEQMSEMLSQIRAMGIGEGGKIEITADNISLKEFSLLSTNTRVEATGDAGDIILDADTISITEGAIVDGITENDSNGGNIAFTARVLEIASGGKVTTSTDGNGNSGNITLNITDKIDIDGSNVFSGVSEERFQEERLNELEAQTGLLVSTSDNSQGDGGNIQIKGLKELNLVNNAQISADSQGQGRGGSVNVETEQLSLDNNASISASTTAEKGGEIFLTINDSLTLDNNSTITAQAFGNAQGGNVNIDAKFIIASPDRNNDIIASAERGDGGNINIKAEGVFGLKERNATPPNKTNDIDASSKFGLDGTVSINTPDVGTFKETIETPAIVELQTLGVNACSRERVTQGSSFTIAGKNGLLPQLTEPLSSDAISIEGQSVSRERGQLEKVQWEQIKPVATAYGEIYPARGIIFKENGDIVLTAYPTDNLQRTPPNSPNCRNVSLMKQKN